MSHAHVVVLGALGLLLVGWQPTDSIWAQRAALAEWTAAAARDAPHDGRFGKRGAVRHRR